MTRLPAHRTDFKDIRMKLGACIVRIGLSVLPIVLPAGAFAQGEPPRSVERETLVAAGRANVLDTYLTPLEYTGVNLGLLHRTERRLRRKAAWSVVAHYGANAASLNSPTDDGRELDAYFAARGGLLHAWRVRPNLRLALGFEAGGGLGFTYNTRLQNNPAQARLALEASALALAETHFNLWRRSVAARLELSAPVAGMQFVPGYGRSYYEIFSLGHSGGIFRFAHPFNAPSLNLSARLALPLTPQGRTRLTFGYEADIRQHTLANTKHHAWRHGFTVGFRRTGVLLK